MSDRFYAPRFQAFDDNGDPLPGAKLFFYEAGTTTPAETYSDAARTQPNANPVIADSAGRFGNIFLTSGDAYKAVLKTADDVTVWTADPIA
jgi:hypothetical protein